MKATTYMVTVLDMGRHTTTNVFVKCRDANRARNMVLGHSRQRHLHPTKGRFSRRGKSANREFIMPRIIGIKSV